MHPMVKKTLRSRWFVAGLHASLWLLVYLALTRLGGKAPDFRDSDSAAPPPQSPAPVAGLERLFSPGIWSKSLLDTNRLNPFFTPYFIPPAAPLPTTRKIEVTYQGFYQTGDDLKRAIFKLGEAPPIAPPGARIATNPLVAQATMPATTLTNLSAPTNNLSALTNGETYVVAPIGARIATNLFIAEATMQAMTLTNLSAQTNILPLNTKKEIVVPIR
jgi:hypothetical protein